MAGPHGKPNLSKVRENYTYSRPEIAKLFGVSGQTVRNWHSAGLQPIDDGTPPLYLGASLKEFLRKKKANRKSPTPLGKFYCLSCRTPRPVTPSTFQIRNANSNFATASGECAVCRSKVNRNLSLKDIAKFKEAHEQIQVALDTLISGEVPCLNLASVGETIPNNTNAGSTRAIKGSTRKFIQLDLFDL